MLSRAQWKRIKGSLVEICDILGEKVKVGELDEDVLKQVLEFTTKAHDFDPFETLKGKGMFIYWAEPAADKGWYHANIDKDGELVYSRWRVIYNKTSRKWKLTDDNKDEEDSTHNLKKFPIKKGKSKQKPKAFDYLLAKELVQKRDLKKLPNDNKVGITKFAKQFKKQNKN